MAVNSSNFELMIMKVETDSGRKVDHIDVEVVANDYAGTFWFTDIMFQSGTVATTWQGHVSELRYSYDNA